MNACGERNNWRTVWEKNTLSPRVSETIARGFWNRLLQEVPVGKDWVGLDFGFGQGYLLRLMAGSMSRVYGLEVSTAMTDFFRRTVGGSPNVEIEIISRPPELPHSPALDLIVVNSCVQYLDDRELEGWLGWWIRSLSPRGRLVLSDLYPRHNSRWRNFRKTLVWGWRQGCLWSVFHEFFLLFRHGYFRELHYGRDPGEMLELIGTAGGSGRVLPRNLDFLPTRDAIITKRE